MAPKLKLDNRLRFALICGLLLVVVSLAVLATGKTSSNVQSKTALSCGAYRTDKVVRIYGQTFNAETPLDQAAFNKGLGGRPCIMPNQAMLFPFRQPSQYAFWMKDMKFPIDMIWVGPDLKVVAVDINVQPATYPGKKFANPQNQPAQFVLEIKANRSKELNLVLGTPVNF